MNCPDDNTTLSAPEPPPGMQLAGENHLENPSQPVRTDRLYQIAALAAGIILLATVL
ncbi:MAG TPA: hypothetical protein VFE38_04730 [Edaphobacter sp.]|nr:hypothetical protein [Edaphobacter sp.]